FGGLLSRTFRKQSV
ncbi:acylphosphatase, partial [Escherichia coli PA49]